MKTDLMKKALFLLLAGVMVLNFTACDKDDENGNGTDDPDALVINPKEYLQNSLVRVDDAGKFMYRVCGAPLEADTTILYVGVDNLAEAKTLFKDLFVPGTAFSESADNISCTLEENGGTVTFTPASGSDGKLADVAFSGCNLVAVSSLHFIEKSAWPDNDGSSPYKKGQKVRKQTLINGEQDWICLREAEKGQKGILYYLSPSVSADGYKPHIPANCPTDSEVMQVLKLLEKNGVWCGDKYYAVRTYAWDKARQKGLNGPVLEFSYFDSSDPLDAAQVGDFYMKDGTVKSKDARLTDAEKDACIGIIAWRGNPTGYDGELKRSHPGCTHGLVVAKYNALGEDGKDAMQWSDEAFYTGTTPFAGFSNTQRIRKYNENPSTCIYPVDAIDNYPDDRVGQSAPSCSSGWYLPAERELRYVGDVRETLKSQLSKVNGEWGSYFYSSTEGLASQAVILLARKNETKPISKTFKAQVRPILAF